jgi:hypothetical protein
MTKLVCILQTERILLRLRSYACLNCINTGYPYLQYPDRPLHLRHCPYARVFL